MAYIKTNWVNNQTPLNEVNLNKLEQGVKDAHDNLDQYQIEIDTVKDTVDSIQLQVEGISNGASIGIIVEALCWKGTCEVVPSGTVIDALTWR